MAPSTLPGSITIQQTCYLTFFQTLALSFSLLCLSHILWHIRQEFTIQCFHPVMHWQLNRKAPFKNFKRGTFQKNFGGEGSKLYFQFKLKAKTFFGRSIRSKSIKINVFSIQNKSSCRFFFYKSTIRKFNFSNNALRHSRGSTGTVSRTLLQCVLGHSFLTRITTLARSRRGEARCFSHLALCGLSHFTHSHLFFCNG